MCRFDKGRRVPKAPDRELERLTTIAALLNVPVESFFQTAEAAPVFDAKHAAQSEQEQLIALCLSLDRPNRSAVLATMRYLAAGLPEA